MNNEEIKRVEEIFLFCQHLLIEKSKEYGDIWKNDCLGHKATFVELNAKYGRLKNLIWDNKINGETEHRVADTLIDMINYCTLTLLLIEKEKGEVIELDKKIEINIKEAMK